MKLLLCLALLSSSAFAAQTNEFFYRAADKEVLVQGGYSFVKQQFDFDNGGDSETSQTSINLRAEYGINANSSVGVLKTKTYFDNEEGFGDHNFYYKGQRDKLQYELLVSISPGDRDNDNFYSGGNHWSLEIGYMFTANCGLNFYLQPEYDYEFKDDNSDYTAGRNTLITAYYENNHENLIYGFSGSFLTIKPSKEDGDEFGEGDDTRYFQAAAYGNYGYKDFELLPSLQVWRYLGDSDLVDSGRITFLNLEARKRF